MLELSRALLARAHRRCRRAPRCAGPDGRFYTKNAAGQAVLALPLVAVAEGGRGRAA